MSDDWSWCDVAFEDNRGWIYAPYLSYVYQGARVPFYTYAPSFGIPIIAFSLGSYWDRYYRGRPRYGRRDYWERREPRHVRPPGAVATVDTADVQRALGLSRPPGVVGSACVPGQSRDAYRARQSSVARRRRAVTGPTRLSGRAERLSAAGESPGPGNPTS